MLTSDSYDETTKVNLTPAGRHLRRRGATRLLIATLAVAVFRCAAASAQVRLLDEEQTRLSVGVGVMQLFDEDRDLIGCVELRPGINFHRIHPWMLAGFSHQGCWYVAAGALANLGLGRNWVLTPSFGVGLYESDELKLGSRGEFRSAIEIARRLSHGQRLGLALAHISNGSTGDVNPGTETLSLVYSLPLEWLFGWW